MGTLHCYSRTIDLKHKFIYYSIHKVSPESISRTMIGTVPLDKAWYIMHGIAERKMGRQYDVSKAIKEHHNLEELNAFIPVRLPPVREHRSVSELSSIGREDNNTVVKSSLCP